MIQNEYKNHIPKIKYQGDVRILKSEKPGGKIMNFPKMFGVVGRVNAKH